MMQVVALTKAVLPNEATFLEAWKAAAALIGERYFGDGSPGCVRRAEHKNDLRPRLEAISGAIDSMSPGERAFLLAVLSFYNWRIDLVSANHPTIPSSVGQLAASCDLARRAALSMLITSYAGW